MKKAKSNVIVAFAVLIQLYFTSVLIMTCYYWWKDAKMHESFARAVFWSPIVGMFKATHWPYYAFFQNDNYSSHSGTHGSTQEKAKKLFDSAAKKVAIGDYKGAIEDYSEVINNYSKATEIDDMLIATAFAARGSTKTYIGDIRGAIMDCNSAIEINPSLAHPYMIRGSIKCRLNDYIGGIEDYNKAFERNLNPREATETYAERGMAKFRINDYKGAIEDFSNAIELNPKYADAYAGRGLSKIMLKDKTGGCLDLNKAKELGLGIANDLIKKWCQ
jgi:tetratricopeptide (TPR) repeat protein